MKKLLLFTLASISAFAQTPGLVGAAGSTDLTSQKLAWISTWSYNQKPLTNFDIKAMIIHSVDQFNLPYPQTSATFELQNPKFLSHASVVGCFLTPTSPLATKMSKPTFMIISPEKNPKVTFSYKWTNAQIAEINKNNASIHPEPMFWRVQLSCQRR